MPHSALTRVIISVGSVTPSLDFYANRLSLRLAHEGSGMATLIAGNVEVLLHERASAPSDTSMSLCFTMANLDEFISSWQAAGGQVVDPAATQPWGEYMAVVRDPDGHLVCLVQAR